LACFAVLDAQKILVKERRAIAMFAKKLELRRLHPFCQRFVAFVIIQFQIHKTEILQWTNHPAFPQARAAMKI